jgi:hypothetical protein
MCICRVWDARGLIRSKERAPIDGGGTAGRRPHGRLRAVIVGGTGLQITEGIALPARQRRARLQRGREASSRCGS